MGDPIHFLRSPRLVVLPGIKDWCTSSDNPYKVDKIIAIMKKGLSEYLRLRLKMDRAIRKPKIEYSTIFMSLSLKETGA